MSPATKLGLGTLCALLAAILTLAVWPASEADNARDDGEQLGAAVSALYDANSPEQVDTAIADLQDAAAETRTHVADRFDEQIDDTQDALSRAADGFVGSATTDGWDQDLYEAELDAAVDDLDDQVTDTREDAPEVVQAFWDGFDSGLTTTA